MDGFARKVVQQYMDHRFNTFDEIDRDDLRKQTYRRFGADQAIKALEEYPADPPLSVLQSLYFEYRMYEERSTTVELKEMFEEASSEIEEVCLLFV